MTQPTLAGIRERVANATPGPWEWAQSYGMWDEDGNTSHHWSLKNPELPDGGVGDGLSRVVNGNLITLADYSKDMDGTPLDETPDFQFIAHAREDIPYLLALVDELEEALKPFADIAELIDRTHPLRLPDDLPHRGEGDWLTIGHYRRARSVLRKLEEQ